MNGNTLEVVHCAVSRCRREKLVIAYDAIGWHQTLYVSVDEFMSSMLSVDRSNEFVSGLYVIFSPLMSV